MIIVEDSENGNTRFICLRTYMENNNTDWTLITIWNNIILCIHYIGTIGTNTFIVVPSHTICIVDIHNMKTTNDLLVIRYIVARDSPALKIGVGWWTLYIIVWYFSSWIIYCCRLHVILVIYWQINKLWLKYCTIIARIIIY